MTWKLKKYCSFFRCCSVEAPRPDVDIGRVNRSVRGRSRPPKQKQGLLELLSSYQLAKNRAGGDMQGWAAQWAKSGTLLHLVDIAYRLGHRVDDSSMDLVCLNAALMVSYLPQGTVYIKDLLQRISERIFSSKGRNALGVYRLLLVLVRIEEFRKEALECDFVDQLHDRYRRCIFNRPSLRLRAETEETDEESDEEAVTSSEEEIMDDLLEQRPNEDRRMQPVPKLNFAWLKNTPSPDNAPRRHDHTLSIDRPLRVDMITTSDRSTACTSNRSDNQGGGIKDRSLADIGSIQKIKNLFRHKNRNRTEGPGHVLRSVGLTETIALLGKLNDSCFMLKYDLLADPAEEWRLTSFWKEKMIDPRDREKLALLEVFLCIGKTAREMPIRHAIIDSMVAHTLKIIHTNTLDQSLLRHLTAAYVNMTSAPMKEQTVEGYVRRLPNEEATEIDLLLETLIEECNKLTSIRRPGDEVFDRLDLVLRSLREYLVSSPRPSKIIQDLIFVLSSVKKMFLKTSKVLHWTSSYVQAFRSLLLFHEAAFKKIIPSKESVLLEQLVDWNSDEDSTQLLKEYSKGILFEEEFQWLKTQERYDLIVETWQFFTEFVYSLTHIKERNMHNRFLDGFDFLLEPNGLIAIILGSNDAEEIICEQVLKFIIASCSLVRTTSLVDVGIVEYHLKLLISRFLERFVRSSNHQSSVLSLHLQAITSLMECCGSNGLEIVLNSTLAELLVGEVHEASLCVAPSTYIQREFHGGHLPPPFSTSVHQNECYASSTRPSTGREMTKQFSFPTAEPVEDFSISSSDDDDGALVETLNLSLPFGKGHERSEEISVALSNLSEENPSDPPSRRPSTTSVELLPRRRVSRAFEDSTVDQIHNELFGRTSDRASIENDSSEDSSDSGEWPSDLSVHGDIDEDGRRWEKYKAEKAFQDNNISFEEMQNRINALTTTSSEDMDTPPPVTSFSVPLLNFDRLTMAPSDSASGAVSAQARNPPFDDSPSVSNPPQRSAERGKEALHSAASPLELSPVHHRYGSVFSSAGCMATGRMVRDDALHLASVEFLIELLILQDKYGDLSSSGCRDLVASTTSVLFFDLNRPEFREHVPDLLSNIHKRGPDAVRMLRLLLEELFEIEQYSTVDRVYKGEVAQVKRCALTKIGKGLPKSCVVKVLDSPREFFRSDASILNIYSEISLLESVSNEPGFCQIYDYGIRSDSAYIVMQDCRCSLTDWIEVYPVSQPTSIRLLLNIFKSIAQSVHRLHQKVIVHFDLKCSNILLEGGSSDDGFWFPKTENPEFNVLLADFGEARCYKGQDIPGTFRNRGTEYFKAPEMLLINMQPDKSVNDFDRRRMKWAGPSCDVWALGCLLFELLTGEMLHYDNDWLRFYARVAQARLSLFDDEKIKLLDISYRSEIVDLMHFIMVRDPQYRPSIAAIIDKVDGLLNGDALPRYLPPRIDQGSISYKTVLDSIKGMTVTEWMPSLLGNDNHFTLNMSQLRLSVTMFDGNLYSMDMSRFIERLESMVLLGVVYVGEIRSNKACDFGRCLRSRIRGFCHRHQIACWFIGHDGVHDEGFQLELKRVIAHSSVTEGTIALCTVSDCAMFSEFLLESIMILEDCSCLRAISILKERVKDGSNSKFY